MNYYDKTAGGYEELHQEEQFHKLQLIKDNLSIKKNAKILDVGCGPCWSGEFFDNVVGVDASSELLAQNKNKKIKTVLGHAEALPFPDHSFDVVLCVTAVHHFELDKALAEMKRVGKDVFVVTVLKKSKNKEKIIQKIKEYFVVEKEIDEGKDIILFLRSA